MSECSDTGEAARTYYDIPTSKHLKESIGPGEDTIRNVLLFLTKHI